ncbi:MAG: SRPBCC family protein [Streptosporangiales bacterium]|nr:SRPBCC family protein [Streptosporangiales bacterium]MBO0890107.1 SRPBCC family protein [Acidothermales bacterium]
MKLANDFWVALPVDEAWELLTDLPRIAPCLPGAHLDDVVDGEYRGGLATKIGPINARYRGVARFVERDDVDHRAVIEARGSEERGSGAASGTVVATLRPDGAGTRVDLSTELAISGRAAQFGRSLVAEVSATMLAEFARRLEAVVRPGPAAAGSRHEAGELDVVRTFALPLLRRAAVPAVFAVVAGVVGWLIGHSGRPSAG